MKDYLLTEVNLHDLVVLLQKELKIKSPLIISAQGESIGKWGMARLWRAWMTSTAKWMADNGSKMPLCYKKDGKPYGSRPFNQNDAHELFTAQWLNVDNEGVRLSWAKSDHDGMRKATKGERYRAMMLHENYCLERGIFLFNPRESEFAQLKDQQNK